jgi:hypothetical protein
MLPTFSNSAQPNQRCQQVSIDAQCWTTEAGYRPVFEGCLPLKCDFVIFFQKTSFYVVFCVWQPAFVEQTPHQTLMISIFYHIVTALFDN